MVTLIKTRRSDNAELARKEIADNWFMVYQDIARYGGRRLRWLGRNVYEVIFTEKNYTLTLIKH